MVYTMKESDGYVKVASGACQLQCKIGGNELGVTHTMTPPANTDVPEFIFGTGVLGPYVTLGSDDCYVKAMSSIPITFSVIPI